MNKSEKYMQTAYTSSRISCDSSSSLRRVLDPRRTLRATFRASCEIDAAGTFRSPESRFACFEYFDAFDSEEILALHAFSQDRTIPAIGQRLDLVSS